MTTTRMTFIGQPIGTAADGTKGTLIFRCSTQICLGRYHYAVTSQSTFELTSHAAFLFGTSESLPVLTETLSTDGASLLCDGLGWLRGVDFPLRRCSTIGRELSNRDCSIQITTYTSSGSPTICLQWSAKIYTTLCHRPL